VEVSLASPIPSDTAIDKPAAVATGLFARWPKEGNGKHEMSASDRSKAEIGGNGSGRERGDPWVRLASADPLGRNLELAPDPVGSKRQINLATQLVG
jgi:hypothetical protein